MGNVLHRARFARAVCDEHQSVRDVVAWVADDPALLRISHVYLGGTVFHYAARLGKLELLQSLIWVAARYAQRHERRERQGKLHGLRPDMCWPGCSGSSAHARQQQVQCLLNQTAGLDDTPLHEACRQGHVDVVALLLQHGANPHLQDRRGANTALHLAAAHRTHSQQLVRVVLNTAPTFPLLHVAAAGALADTAPPPAAAAAAVSDPGDAVTATPSVAVQDFLEGTDICGCTPLHRAVAMQNMDAVDQLLEVGNTLLLLQGFLCIPHPVHFGEGRGLQKAVLVVCSMASTRAACIHTWMWLHAHMAGSCRQLSPRQRTACVTHSA